MKDIDIRRKTQEVFLKIVFRVNCRFETISELNEKYEYNEYKIHKFG